MHASLIGRSPELDRLRRMLDAAAAGRARTLLLHGGSGMGKSRLIRTAEEDALRRGFHIARARGHPVESGVAFAVLSDALVPLLAAQPASRLSAHARGAADDLHRLFPMLGSARTAPPESSVQLYWTLAEVLRVLGTETPILVAVDDLQWADASSLEALHFLARQLGESRVAMLWTLNDEAERSGALTAVRSSLASLHVLDEAEVAPLTPEDGSALVRWHLDGSPVSEGFVAALLERTRGNPLFIEALIRELQERGGSSVFEDDVLTVQLPGTITAAVHARFARHDPFARLVAECLSVIGTRAPLPLLRAVVGAEGAAVDAALDALVEAQVLHADETAHELSYEFCHPLTRDTLYTALGAARRRTLHARVAAVLAAHKPRGESLAAEIAPHILRGGSAVDARGIDYLTIAGRAALSRFATAEAAAYLCAASEAAARAGIERPDVLELLARARQRQGDHPAAITLLTQLRDYHRARGDEGAVAKSARRIALVLHLAGRLEEALAEYDRVLPAAAAGADPALLAKVELERASILNRTGRVGEARAALHSALRAARHTGAAGTIARVHRDLLLFHSMSGPPALAREHGDEALRLAEEATGSALISSCHWARAVLEGLTGNAAACAQHTREALHHADLANSPILRLAALEISIEQAFSTGEWDAGLATGTAAIALARTLNDRQILPRLLVWTSLIHMGRGALLEAEALVTEAWTCSGADTDSTADVHAVVPAHIGRAALHLARLEFDAGIAVAEAGLVIVDRTGYRAWAVYRLLPILAESYLHKHDFASARRVEDRLRAEGTLLENPLALAWADTSAAILTWIEGDPQGAAEIMRGCVEGLEAVPFVPDAARLRRQLAGRLAETGQRDAALRELRIAYGVFQRLDYRPELEKARGMFRELDARPPGRLGSARWLALTDREQDVAREVAAGRSNKAIARELAISVRTVSTHLSNIFRKLELTSRDQLTDYVRMAPNSRG